MLRLATFGVDVTPRWGRLLQHSHPKLGQSADALLVRPVARPAIVSSGRVVEMDSLYVRGRGRRDAAVQKGRPQELLRRGQSA